MAKAFKDDLDFKRTVYACAMIRDGKVEFFYNSDYKPTGKPTSDGGLAVLVKTIDIDISPPPGWDGVAVAAKGYEAAMADVDKKAAALKAKFLEQHNKCLALPYTNTALAEDFGDPDDDIPF